MKSGDVVAGRWALVAEAPGEAEVARWRAVDAATGVPVEVLGLRSPASFSSPANAAFADVHRRVSRAVDPALVSTVDVVEWEGRAYVARDPLEDATLADVGRLDPGEVAALGALLLPAVIAVGGATGGALLPQDVGIDPTGRPVLAPRGRPAARVGRDATRWVAPEAFQGRPPDAAAGLYGLGVLLYRLATGRDPVGAAPPPPSTVQRGIPGDLDAAILQLLSPDPNRRAGALPLLQAVGADVPDLRRRVSVSKGPEDVVVTRRGPPLRSSGAADVRSEPPRVAVVVPADALAKLDPAARAVAAGWAEVPESAIDALVAAQLPLVLSPARDAASARRRADELQRDTRLPVAVTTPVGCAWWLLLGSGTSLAALLALIVVMAAIPLLWPLVAVLAAVALGGVVLRAMDVRAQTAIAKAWRELEAVKAPGREALARARGRIAELRRRLATADLPLAAAADLRAGLRDIEAQLEQLGRAEKLAIDALERADLHALRTRLAALTAKAPKDADAATERDRVARALADFEDVERRRDRARAEMTRIEDALDEVNAALGQTEAVEGPAVERLVRVSRAARESMKDFESR